MGDWWMTGFAVMAVAALVMLGLGLWLGYRWGRADREAESVFGPIAAGVVVPAQEAEEFWANVKLDVAAATSHLEQPPLSALVSPPGRATDWIERITADTDRWIAGIETKDE